MLQVSSQQIQAIRQNLNLSFRQEVIDLLEQNGYETIENPETIDIGIKDKSGNLSWLRYNEQALPSTFELPSGTNYQLKYYSDGALQSVQMPNGNALELFTQDGKLISLKHKGGSSLSVGYTQYQKISEVRISNKKKYQFKYAPTYGHLDALIDGNGQTKHFHHDNSGNLRQKIDAENRTTYFHYEVGEDDLRFIQYPDGSRESYKFDEENNYLEITQRNNAYVKNHYDDNDNLRQVDWQDGSFMLIEYDEKEEISSIQNEHSLTNFNKDNKGQITAEVGEFGTISYEYDVEDRLSKVIYADGYELNYQYDIDGELAEIKDSDGNIHKFSFDAKSSTSKIVIGDGNVQYALREHFNGQIAETSINTNLGNSYGQLYEYDDQERLAKIYDAKSKFPTRTLHYDDADHLLEVKTEKEKTVEKFAYDRSGQMVEANGKLLAIGAMEEVKVYGEHVLAYDANGNLSSFLGVKATFKHNNTLDTIEAKGHRWQYQYDAFGRRIGKTNGKETIKYVWAGVQLYEEIRTANGIETRQKYLYRPFEQIPYAIKDEKGLYLLQQDQRGAIIRAVSETGEVVWEAEYDAFGKAYPRTDTIHQPWRLQGQYFDVESDLHYNVGRYYSPTLKTYLSRDPRWYEVEASNYNYSNNDPYNKTDSLGAFWHIVGGAVVGAVVGGVIAYRNGGDWKRGALIGGVSGAVGAAVGAWALAGIGPTLLGSTFLANVAGGAIGGAAAGATEAIGEILLNGKKDSIGCSLKKIGENALMGAAFGGLLGGVLGVVARPVGNFFRGLFRGKTPNPKLNISQNKAITNIVSNADDLVGHRKDHILNGHRFGANKPDKTEFPQSWSDDKIINEINKIANNPSAPTGMGKWNSPYKTSNVEGIEIRVDFYPENHPKYAGKVSTAYPTNTQPNPPKN